MLLLKPQGGYNEAERLIEAQKLSRLKDLASKPAPAGKFIDPMRWYRAIAVTRLGSSDER